MTARRFPPGTNEAKHTGNITHRLLVTLFALLFVLEFQARMMDLAETHGLCRALSSGGVDLSEPSLLGPVRMVGDFLDIGGLPRPRL